VVALDVAGALRRIRRTADLSQRQLADACGVSQSVIARAEAGARDLPVSVFVRAAAVAGARLIVLDQDGHELDPMDPEAVRDGRGRFFPAHVDTRYGDVDWWHGDERYSRERPWYTFDRKRYTRDHWRERSGTPEDHQLPQRGDSPAERAAERRRAARQRADEERRAELEAAGPSGPDWGTGCACLPDCEYEEGRNEDLSHATGCPCCCDLD
jgi:transcriptional regulator with XRE-family HTH domain